MADILIIGELLAEIMAERAGQRFDEPGVFLGPYPSGAPGIFIDQAAKAGAAASIIGCVGRDGFGDQIVKRLSDDGVDVSRIRRSDSRPTGTAFVSYEGDGSRKFIFNIAGSAAAEISENLVERQWMEGASFFHVMGSFLGSDASRSLVFKALELAADTGVKISFDPNVRAELLLAPGAREALFDVLSRCSIFLPSEADIDFLFGKAEEEHWVHDLFGRYARLSAIVIKKSRRGASYYDRTRRIDAPAFQVEEVDPTGAGDAFGGAFLAGLVRRVSPSVTLDIACAAGALAVTKRGPMEGTATLSQIEAFMAGAKRV